MTNSFNPSLQFHMITDGSHMQEDKDLALKMAKYIESIINSEFFEKRNEAIDENMNISAGRQSMREFMSALNIDGKKSYINLDWTPPMIAPKFMEVLNGNFMKRNEKPKCSAVDPISIKSKKHARDMAEFRMLEPELVKEVDDALGRYQDRESFTPKSYDELDIFFNVDYRMPEEILMENGVKTVMKTNNWTDIKRRILQSIRDAGFGVTRTYADADGYVHVESIDPRDYFSTYSEKNDFADAYIMGHRVNMKVYDIRKIFQLPETEVFEISKSSLEHPNPTSARWSNDYMKNGAKPYDDYSVEVVFFEAKTNRPQYWVQRNMEDGRVYFSKKENRPHELGADKILIEKYYDVIFEGAYIQRAKKVLMFRRKPRTIRSSNPKELSKALFSYSVYMHDNNNMKNTPLTTRIRSSVRSMTLALLKIQQLMAKMRPSGIAVDISGIKSVNLGEGNLSPLELQRVYDHTGNVYYESTDEDGERKDLPIRELPNLGNVQQINSLIETYNFYLNKIRDEIGVNEYREGSSVNPKLGLGVLQTQIRESNNATDYIYDSYLQIAEQTINKVGILLHDSVVYGGKAYREYFTGIELSKMYFDFILELSPSEEEKQLMESAIQIAMQQNQIDLADAIKIRRIENVKLQEIYLVKARRDKAMMEQQIAAQNSQMNAQIQEASMKAKAEADAQLEMTKAQAKIALSSEDAKSRMKENLQKFVHTILEESFKTGREITGAVKDIVDGYFAQLAQEAQMEAQRQQAMQAQQQQEMLAQQGISPEQLQMMEEEQMMQEDGGGDMEEGQMMEE